METVDRGYAVPTLRDQWILIKHIDGSGEDFYLRPTAIVGVSINNPERTEVSMWILQHDEVLDQGGKERPTVFTFTGEHATKMLDFLDRSCGMVTVGTWEREEAEVPAI